MDKKIDIDLRTHNRMLEISTRKLPDGGMVRTYTDVTAQLAAANTQVAMSQIDLFLALGGGWESGRTQGSNASKP